MTVATVLGEPEQNLCRYIRRTDGLRSLLSTVTDTGAGADGPDTRRTVKSTDALVLYLCFRFAAAS